LLSAGRPRRHGDGGCLYLQINGPDRGAWVFMVKRGGKQRPIGLGSVRDVPLKDARELAEACRHALRRGHDPRTVVAEASGEMTFDTAARELIESMAPGWRNAKHRAQWSMTLLGEVPDKDGNRKKTRYWRYRVGFRRRLLRSAPQQAGIQAHHRGRLARAQAALADAAGDRKSPAWPL
jgi:hypothetical protein